jgi:23S rRNA (adenine-N6)-dimethyltransferase
VPGDRRRSARDRGRRTYGQNPLVDRRVAERAVARADLGLGDLVVDVGAGRGALTVPLARTGARVIAVERDRHMVRDLRAALAQHDLLDRVEIRRGDLRRFPWPAPPYHVVASPPFGLTTALLGALLDDPGRGPERADLLLQWEVAQKRAATPPTTLRSAAWAPWWTFELGERVRRDAFRPVPAVEAGWLVIRRRDPPVLPTWMAPGMVDLLRPAWTAHHG